LAIVEAVLWDMDGVLVDSERLVQEVFAEQMLEHNVMANPAQRYLETVGLNHKGTVNWYLQFVESEELAEHYCSLVGKKYLERIEAELQLKDGVIDALEAVAETGLPQMVVTSSKTEHALTKLKMFNIDGYFQHIIGGDQVEQGKPNPEPYLKACKHLSVDPSRALIIEDSPNGVTAGLAAGCMVIHVPDLIDTNPDWQDAIYNALDSLESFPRWFEMQRGGDWL